MVGVSRYLIAAGNLSKSHHHHRYHCHRQSSSEDRRSQHRKLRQSDSRAQEHSTGSRFPIPRPDSARILVRIPGIGCQWNALACTPQLFSLSFCDLPRFSLVLIGVFWFAPLRILFVICIRPLLNSIEIFCRQFYFFLCSLIIIILAFHISLVFWHRSFPLNQIFLEFTFYLKTHFIRF